MWVQKHFSLLFFAVSFYLISNVTSICGSMSLNYPWKVALVLHMHSISYAICTNIVPIFSSQTFCYISKNALVNGIPLFPFTFQWISCKRLLYPGIIYKSTSSASLICIINQHTYNLRKMSITCVPSLICIINQHTYNLCKLSITCVGTPWPMGKKISGVHKKANEATRQKHINI